MLMAVAGKTRPPRVGIIANPVSARDIRRIIANATSLQITDRANIVLRVLACLKACGVEEVLMMPETAASVTMSRRGVDRSKNRGEEEFPNIVYLNMLVTGRRLTRFRPHNSCASRASRRSSSWAATEPIVPS